MIDHPAPLKVLVACEFTGTVRSAFNAAGHDAWSCDLLPAADGSNRHLVGNVLDLLDWQDWDLLMVAHPPCTRLCNSGVRWLNKAPDNPPAECTDIEKLHWSELSDDKRLQIMWRLLDEGADLFSRLWNCDIPHKCLENPVMHKHAKQRIDNYQPFAQSVQPWQFGTDPDSFDNQKKRTCLWLDNLPQLTPTGTLDGSTAKDLVHKAPPGPERWKARSMFFPGIAKAMADQWGDLKLKQAQAA